MLLQGILVFVVFAIIVLSFVVLSHLRTQKAEMRSLSESLRADQSMLMLNQNMIGVQERLDKTSDALNARLDNAARVISLVQKDLSTMQEIGRGMKEFQEMLTSPKLRGNLGEQILNDSLAQVFSQEHYDIQYRFRDGQTVDAVVKSASGIIPIDSKFPLENFRKMISAEDESVRKAERKEAFRAVKKHIDDIANKYILPAEGTVDFAVMYVPSENIFYELLTAEEDVMEYSRQSKILLVSPNSFFHFLRVLLMGLERAKMQEETKRILELIHGIRQESMKFGEALSLTQKHITNAKNAMDATSGEYLKLSGIIDQMKLLQ